MISLISTAIGTFVAGHVAWILGGLAIVGGLLGFGHAKRKQGAAEQDAAVINSALRTGRKVDEAQRDRPGDAGELVKRLRDHGF